MFFNTLCLWPVQITPSPYQGTSEPELLSNTNLAPWFSIPLERNLPHHRLNCRPTKSADRVRASVFLDQSPHFTGEESRKVRWFFPRIFSRVRLRNQPTVSNITSRGLILSANGRITSSQHVWTACLLYPHPALLRADRVCLVLKGLCEAETGKVNGNTPGIRNRGLLTAARMLRALSSRPSPAPSRPTQVALPARKYFFPLAVSYFGALSPARAPPPNIQQFKGYSLSTYGPAGKWLVSNVSQEEATPQHLQPEARLSAKQGRTPGEADTGQTRASLEEHGAQRGRLSETHLFWERLLFSCGNNGYGSAAIMDSEPSRERRGCGTEAVADWLTLEAAWTCVFGWCWRRLVYCKELWPK